MLRSSLTLLPSLILLCDMAIANDSFLMSDSGKYFTQLFLSSLIIYTSITFPKFERYFHLRFIFTIFPVG